MFDDFSNNVKNDKFNTGCSSAEAQASYITMKIVAFLNARHYMVFADKKGKPHGHSWQLQAEAKVPVKYDSFIKFEDLDELLNKLLAPYQRSVLNEIPPFDSIEPLTENISVYFFNLLYDALKKLDVNLVKLSVWENPTKGIEITECLPQYFFSGDNILAPASVAKKTLEEVALSVDNGNAMVASSPPPEPEQDVNAINEAVLPAGEAVSQVPASNSDTASDCNNSLEVTDIVYNEKQLESEPAPYPGVPVRIAERVKSYLSLRDKPPEEEKEHSPYPWWQIILAALVITGVAIWAYWPIISAPSFKVYPYGYDSWCHILKTEFLIQQSQQGNYYPQFFQYWHNGVEPFRYWGPLSNYIIALINLVTKNVFNATNLYIFVCALLGGLAWLCFSNRIGLVRATMGGIIWVFWVDNLKEAFRVGNYPRLLTICILPLLTEFFLRVLEKEKNIFPLIVCVLSIHMVVLCHAMIAAIYCVSLMMVAIFLWVNGGISFKSVIRGGITLTLGILSSSWWLIPSLKGGVVSFAEEAAGGAVRFVSIHEAFNPLNMVSANYMGISLIVAIFLILFFWRSYPKWARALSLCGILLIIFSLPQFKMIQNALPMHHLLWPLRFSSFWSLALILTVLSLPKIANTKKYFNAQTSTVIITIVFLCFFLDSSHSLSILGHTISETLSYKVGSVADKEDVLILPESETLKPILNSIANHSGWKVATLDLSRLGSSPSFFLTHDLGREQVFGWAWQGAKTANNVMLLNTAIEKGWYPFLLQRLGYMGGTDLLALNSRIKDREGFARMAQQTGYSLVFNQGSVSHWHGLNAPYLPVFQREGLAIGKYASIYALQFPGLVIGNSMKVDDYDLEQLKQFKVIVLTGVDWSSRKAAESLIKEYAAGGGRVIVDLNGFPNDILARQPMFLGVYGEPVSLTGSLKVSTGDEENELLPFDIKDWRTIIPQPLDSIEMNFQHYGNKAALIGNIKISDISPIYYTGANLAYHCFLTHDPVGIKILEDTLQISTQYTPYEVIELVNYKANKDGYTMVYSTEKDYEAFIPVAALDGMQVYIDGEPVVSSIYENLILATLPAGMHSLDIKLHKHSVYKLGEYVSLFSALLILGWIYVAARDKYKLHSIS